MAWSEWKKFSGTAIEFDMYCFSNNTRDYGNSRFCSILDNATVTITATKYNTTYYAETLTPSINYYSKTGVYYRTDNVSDYVIVPLGETVVLKDLNYIDVLVLGYGGISGTHAAEAHIKIE